MESKKKDSLAESNPAQSAGEWTAETLWEFIGGKIDSETTGLSKESAVQCYQAINAALAAEREKREPESERQTEDLGWEKACGKFNGKNAEEWFKQLDAKQQELEVVASNRETDFKNYEHYTKENKQLRKQLDAANLQITMDTECIERIRNHGMKMEVERDMAVEALQQMPEVAYQSIIEHAGVEIGNLPNELQCIADTALAKIKEGK